jgi:hypothetical protein
MFKCIAEHLHESAKKIQDKKLDFDRKDAWGYLESINLFDCSPEKVRSKEAIEKYIKELSKIIDCHLYGPPTIAKIGKEKRLYGWSFTQLVTTSSITGHFIEDNNSIYFDTIVSTLTSFSVIISIQTKRLSLLKNTLRPKRWKYIFSLEAKDKSLSNISEILLVGFYPVR